MVKKRRSLVDFNKKCDEVSTLSGCQMAYESFLSNSEVVSLQQIIIMEHRVSNAQLEELLEHLASHPALAKGVGLGARSKETVDREWNDLAQKLNAHGSGATKTGQRWKRYWADIKHKAKIRAAAKRRDASGTGGGPSTQDELSEIDQKILTIIGDAAVFGDSQHSVPVFEIKSSPVPQISHGQDTSDDIIMINITEPELSSTFRGSGEVVAVETVNSPSKSGHTSKYTPLRDVNMPAVQSSPDLVTAERPSTSRPQPKRSLFRDKTTNPKVAKVDSAWVVELETKRIAAEEKIANAAMIMAEAARTNAESARITAESARTTAECARMHCEVMLKLIDYLKK